MIDTKRPFLTINIIVLAAILLGCLFYSVVQLQSLNQLTSRPFLAIINNNLGIKTKLMSLQLTAQHFSDLPTTSNLHRLKMQYKIIRGSINNDLKSDVTGNFHQVHGETGKLIELQEYLDQLGYVLPMSIDDKSNIKQFNTLLAQARRLWNQYSQQVIHSAQKQSKDMHDSWNHSLKIQIYLLAIIGGISLTGLIIISRQLSVQRRMSQTLKEQTIALIDARNAAEESTRAKSRFLSNMSHEIRTPLNGIIGLTNLARQKAIKPEVINYLDKVILSSDTLLHVINDILDVSKIESGKLELEITQVDIADVLERISATMSANARNKALNVYFLVEPEVPAYFQGDPARLQQIITNLVSNAIKFTHEGFIQLKVSFHQASQQLNITITDTGVGIDEKAMDKLFTEFNQGDLSTTRKYGGTGLGLSIVKSLTELMDGTVDVSSSLDVGTCFTIKLPIEASASRVLDIKCSNLDLTTKAVHIIDMSKTANQEAQATLQRTGITFETLNTAQQLLIEFPPLHSKEDLDYIVMLLEQHPDKTAYVLGYPDQLLELSAITPLSFYGIESPFNSIRITECIATETSHHSEASAHIEKQDFNGKHVLLVEDSPINQMIAQEMLDLFGLRVTTADNGEIAADKAEIDHFDLILMDIQMPEMDGVEATKLIRTKGMNQRTPIVALTANVMSEDVKLYKEVGMDSHLPKPFKPDELISTLEMYLNETQASNMRLDN
ncbi:ATP-binding protein [Litoribrevibacter euphylliae]|uniref:histidine kinase n=1 Tax=Litoribrevibacter euphylliae TaxID=1834034 RepID=A0ABV7HFM7_9GAMM